MAVSLSERPGSSVAREGSRPSTPGCPGWTGAPADWGDYDGDGKPRYPADGYDRRRGSRCHRYGTIRENGTFADQTPAGVTGVYRSAAAWGDYDNDGDLDFVLSGLRRQRRPGRPNYGAMMGPGRSATGPRPA